MIEAIRNEIFDIVDRLNWQESRDGFICYETRYKAYCKALGLINRAMPNQFRETRKVLFSVMNEARNNLRGM